MILERKAIVPQNDNFLVILTTYFYHLFRVPMLSVLWKY